MLFRSEESKEPPKKQPIKEVLLDKADEKKAQSLDNIFRILSLEAELEELSIDASIIQAHQHSAGAKKGDLQMKSGPQIFLSVNQSFFLACCLLCYCSNNVRPATHLVCIRK